MSADHYPLPPTTALEAGSKTFNGPLQIYEPKPILLATNSGGGEATANITIRARVPSSQLRVKLSVTFFPAAGRVLPNLGGLYTIWVAACEEDAHGVAGGAGRIIPVTDLEGNSTTPTPFPKTNGLGGYAREFVTAAKYLQAVVGLASGGTPGNWVLQASIQPDAVFFPWDAWDQLRRDFTIDRDVLGNL